MTAPSRRRRGILWGAAMLVCTAALVSIMVGYPRQLDQPVLGGGWHCSRTAFLTSCTRTGPGTPTIHSLQANPIVLRPA